MTRTLYLQCDCGISGDMVVGALLDAGASETGLRRALASLDLEGYDIRVTRKLAGAMDGCDFDVVVDSAHENHDHDMDWLFGDTHDAQGHDHDHHGHPHDHHHEGHSHHGHAGEHHHEHAHEHGHGHHHEHRNLADIRAILERSDLSATAKGTALRIFTIIAEAEAKAHGKTADTVHFHEVGAVDSIVDVAAVAWCLDDLGVQNAVVSALAEGEGHVRCAHGVLPIPVPAVAHIVEAHGLVLRRAHRRGELVTPTGAAIAAAIRTDTDLPEQYRIVSCGVGTGKRAYEVPSVLRATVLEDVQEGADEAVETRDLIWKLETEVDDCTGEALGYVVERLYEAGAREAHFIPVFMKKGRPGYQIEVLCAEDDVSNIERELFENTTTIGIRRVPMERTVLRREADAVDTAFGMVEVKRIVLPSGAVRVYPEHEGVARAAAEHGVSYQDVVRAVLTAMGRQ